MVILRKRNLAAVLMVVFCCALAVAEKITDIHPQNYVTDLAGVLAPETQARVNALALEVEQKTGAQIAVVTVRSIEGRPVQDYANDLFKHLGVGKKDNRGILLLLAPQDRKYWFEVGYGLEPVINDARAGDIGREMVPYLRRNDYSGGVELAASRAATLIADDRGVTLSGPQVARRVRQADPEVNIPWWALPLGLFILFTIIRAVARGGRGGPRGGRRGGGSGWWIGPMIGGGGWGRGGGWGGGGSSWGGGGFGGSSGGFGGFGGGASGGGGAGGSW